MARKITNRQRQVLQFLVNEVKTKGYAPSVREIGLALGLRSPSTVHQHLAALEQKGSSRFSHHRLFSVQFPLAGVTIWQIPGPDGPDTISRHGVREQPYIPAVGVRRYPWGLGRERMRTLGRWTVDLLDLDTRNVEALMYWLHNEGLNAFVSFSETARSLFRKRDQYTVSRGTLESLGRSLDPFRSQQAKIREIVARWFPPQTAPVDAYVSADGDVTAASAWDRVRVSMQRPRQVREPLGRDDEQLVLTVNADDPFALAVIELVWCIRTGLILKTCARCNRPFFPSARADESYCDRPVEGRTRMRGGQKVVATCKNLGPIEAYRAKLRRDPLGLAFDRVRRRLLMNYGKGSQVYVGAVHRARELLGRARKEGWSAEEYDGHIRSPSPSEPQPDRGVSHGEDR